jgi:hypothetical protein
LVHRLPFRRLEHRLATDVRAVPAQPADVEDPPGHDQVDRQARQQSIDGLKSPVLDTAPRLERPKKDLNLLSNLVNFDPILNVQGLVVGHQDLLHVNCLARCRWLGCRKDELDLSYGKLARGVSIRSRAQGRVQVSTRAPKIWDDAHSCDLTAWVMRGRIVVLACLDNLIEEAAGVAVQK